MPDDKSTDKHDSKPLQKIAEIELAGERYDLAKNGQFTLVKSGGVDAYGRPIAESVDLALWAWQGGGVKRTGDGAVNVSRLQALLDALGDATVRLQAQRDARLASRTSDREEVELRS